MKAAVLHQIPAPLEIEDVSVDTPGPHEVLVRTVAAGVCHSDLHFMEGKYTVPTPAVMGHEAAGVVEAVGDQVIYVKPGDRVITCLSIFCGECEYCLTGRMTLCGRQGLARASGEPPRLKLGDRPVGAFAGLGSYAEQMLVHEHGVVKVREEMPLDRAALIGCGVTTGIGAVFHTAKVPPGATVAVIGCGGIGLNCVQGARIAGASRIIAVDRVALKLKLAEQLGATDLIDASAGDAVGQVRDLTAGGVEYAFEAIGLKETAEQAFMMLRRGGTATVIGMVPMGMKVEVPGHELLAEKRLQGSNMGSNRFRVDMPRFVDFYLDGRLKLDELVSARVPLEEINAAYEEMTAGTVARSVITFE